MKKNKWDIIGRNIDKENHQEYDDWFYYWYDGEDYYNEPCSDCGMYHCDRNCAEYGYLPEEEQPLETEYITRGYKFATRKRRQGMLIDMTTIYSKEVLRQKKLEAIFGGEFSIFDRKTYLKDTLNEKDKDILRKLDCK